MAVFAAILFAAAVLGSAPIPGFRPPAIPLITTDPYMQTWMRANTSTGDVVRHWDGTTKEMLGLIRVDGLAYRFLGACVPAIPNNPGPTVAYMGHDISPGSCDILNRQLGTVQCNELCIATPSCAAFVVTGGTCYLKSCVQPVVTSANHDAYVLVGNYSAAHAQTDVSPGTCDIANTPNNGPDACNSACYAAQGCVAFVLSSTTCYLKSCATPLVPSSTRTAYLVTSAHFPPPPCQPALQQNAVTVHPTRTVFELEVPGTLALKLTFLTPMFTDDYEHLSRPTYYISYDVKILDGKSHAIQLYQDMSAEHAVNTLDEVVTWSSWSTGALSGVRIGTVAQDVLGMSGDAVNINWGYLYMTSLDGVNSTLRAGSVGSQRASFVDTGKLPTGQDTNNPRAAGDDLPGLSVVRDLGTLSAARPSAQHVVLAAYDDIYSVYYFGHQFKGYWARNATIMDAMTAASTEFSKLLSDSESHDRKLLKAVSDKAGDMYATIAALAYRQALASLKLVWNPQRNTMWNFLKEISTNGDMQTMDVIFPGSPLLLYRNPELLSLLLEPVLAYANNETWHPFSDPYSPHQLGTYPIANATTAQQEPMPLENGGNMMLMLLGLVQQTNSTSLFYPKYWPLLKSWADYMTTSLPFPADQLCTDDFTGLLANNSNLAAKGIIAIHAFSELCRLSNAPTNCSYYSSIAANYAVTWQQYAYEATPQPHYKMAYGMPGTWSVKYNLLWQKLLKLTGPFPWEIVAPREVAFYILKENEFGTPLDLRHTYQKLDWMTWGSLMADNDTDFHTLWDPIYHMANTTPSRLPLTDLFDTITAIATFSTGFITRFVVGAVYARMLL